MSFRRERGYRIAGELGWEGEEGGVEDGTGGYEIGGLGYAPRFGFRGREGRRVGSDRLNTWSANRPENCAAYILFWFRFFSMNYLESFLLITLR